jgi:trypsin-like peptidase/VWA domain-containing protein
MTHRIGTVQTQGPALVAGAGRGTEVAPGRWKVNLSPPPAMTGTKFLFLHFTAAALGAGDRIEIPLGYDTDVFTGADGPSFWTRPVKGNSVDIFFVDGGSGAGEASVSEFGRGEGLKDGGTPAAAGGIANGDLFMIDTPWVEPTYFNPAGVCPSGASPSWENVEALPPGVLRNAARSVGMFIEASEGNVSTCSAALIEPDLILTAGHCVGDNDEAVITGSFTLDFQTDAAGNRPAGYNPRFFKLKRLVKTGFAVPGVGAGVSTGTGLDYAVIQIETPPAGLGVPPLAIRSSVPATGEELFVVHQPRGTAKKVSRKPTDPTCQVLSISGNTMNYACDSDNGSSGSPVFDATGRIVAVNDWAPGSCGNQGQSGAAILLDFTNPAPAFQDVDGMLVLDRSGSMSQLGFTGVKTKIQEAREAAALFIDLLRTDRTHEAGLATFSTSSTLAFALAPVNPGNKDALIGPAPARDAGIVGGITPGGTTTIGGGLQEGQTALPAPGASANLPAILLLTDGLENTPPMIADVEPTLGNTRLCIIGFGTEGSVDGPRLTTLARSHGGIYTRAGEGLQLKKYFVLAFGNIFQTAVALDPMSVMPKGAAEAEPIPLNVCGEEALTVVLSWEHESEDLQLGLMTPGGNTITSSTAGLTVSSGATWTYLRLQLPFAGERDGVWQVLVSRSRGDDEFPEELREERFFVTATVEGGPYFRPVGPQRYYTGDTLNPQVVLRQPSGFTVHGGVMADIEIPQEGTGNILAQEGLGGPGELDGDTIDARANTLIALERERGPLVPTSIHSFELFDDGDLNGTGSLEPDGVYGRPLEDLMRFEGNYTFHAKATYGEECTGTREATWTLYVAVGIDPDHTDVKTETISTLPDGRQHVCVTFTPRDRYGNYLGPGRLDAFGVLPQPGTAPDGDVQDLGDGSYQVDVTWDPGAGDPPRIGIDQPERPPVVIGPARGRRYIYSVKFLCGEQGEECADCGPVRPGSYATEITIHNHHDREVRIVKRILPLVLAGGVRGREPQSTGPMATDQIVLPAHSATMDDCCRILELLLGARPTAAVPLTEGLLEITSPVELGVTAVYSVTNPNKGSTSIDVQSVDAKLA